MTLNSEVYVESLKKINARIRHFRLNLEQVQVILYPDNTRVHTNGQLCHIHFSQLTLYLQIFICSGP